MQWEGEGGSKEGLNHRRQCCAGSEAEPCGRELWGHFWDSDVPWPCLPVMLTAHTLSRHSHGGLETQSEPQGPRKDNQIG